MVGEYYSPRFSPEEVAERAGRNSKELVAMFARFFGRFKEYEREMDGNIKQLHEMCEDWKLEYYHGCLKTIREFVIFALKFGI